MFEEHTLICLNIYFYDPYIVAGMDLAVTESNSFLQKYMIQKLYSVVPKHKKLYEKKSPYFIKMDF